MTPGINFINEIRRNLYEVENKKNLSAPKIKEIEENLLKLEENLFKTKNYYGYDNTECKGTRDVKNLFDLSIYEDYYEPIIINSVFNNNFIQYYMIRPYLSDTINDHKTQGEWRIHSGNTIIKNKTQGKWKIHLTMPINFISSKEDSDDTRTMYSKSNETDEIFEKLLESLSERYQEGLEESMRGSEFIFDSVDAVYYNLNKTSLSRGGSYIDSPKWLKNTNATINPKNNDDKCFQYAVAVALNYEQIEKDPQRISEIKPFIDQYNWKEIKFPSHKKDSKKFDSNNKSIALNILYEPYNTEEIRHAYKSKHNIKREFQVILLMITDGKKWHYLAVKKVSALFRGITSKHEGDFYCLNCFHSFRIENKLKNIKIFAKIMIIAM